MKKNTAPKGIKIKMSREEIAYQIFIAVVVGLLVLCCLIPFLYVVGMSFTSEGEMTSEISSLSFRRSRF